jgi:predicted dehydrogenase
VPALASVPGLRLAAVADPDPGRRSALGVAGYPCADDLVEAEPLDAVLIVSPAESHLADARAATARGLPCLVEKPPATNASQARELAALDPTPWVGFNRRFDPQLEQLRERSAGDGPLELRIKLLFRSRSWRAYTVDDDVLLDLGPHAFDLVRWLAGEELERVRTTSHSHQRAELEAETGRARASITLATDALWLEQVVVLGGGKLVRGGLVNSAISRLPGRPHVLVESLAAQLAAFADAVCGRPSGPLSSATDAVGVMGAVDAARRSAADRGAWETV